MGTDKCHTGLMNRRRFGTTLLRGTNWDRDVDACHAEDTSCHSARTEVVYDEWTKSSRKVGNLNGLFKCLETIFSNTFRHQRNIFRLP
ncbi:hypothetical protein TNCV_2727181 [Trichonephila clavipes]|nr:hypothetical protein TNCV_2727181 [Trichonephila clavipes]